MVDRISPVSPDQTEIAAATLREAFEATPRLGRLRDALDGHDAHLVGGAVRDLLLDREPHELDVAIEGDAIALARRLDLEATVHERFGTASITLEGGRVDLATARTETYSRGGALPDVEPASIDEDLQRRDFSVNAIALALDELTVRDPTGGLSDLEDGVLRLLHDRSLHDDPTRALRGARYAGRLGLEPDPATLAQLQTAPLGEVSAGRVETELRRAAADPDPVLAFELLHTWSRAELHGDADLARRALTLRDQPHWSHLDRADVLLAATAVACGKYEASTEPLSRARKLAELEAPTPGEALAAAGGSDQLELLLARALGAEWVDEYVESWSKTGLEISGDDLVAAGVEPGEAVGAGLAAALEAKLAGRASVREAQLEIALAAARG